MTRQTTTIWAIAFALTGVGCPSASAQHIDILVWDAGGKLGVGEYDYDNLAASENRVQIARFDEGYSIDSPGFTAFEGIDALPANTNVEWNFLPMTVDSGPNAGYRSTILYWDGVSTEPEFGPTATGDYEFWIYPIDPINGVAAGATGAGDVEDGGVVVATDADGAVHDHPFYFLDDNGDGVNDTLPAAGIYVVGLELSVDGLDPSDPVFMVWATPEFEVLPAIRPAALWVNARVETLATDGLLGDYNANGEVDSADFLLWQETFAATGATLAADGNGDGVVDGVDYAVWRENYAPPASAAARVPEPLSACLLTVLFISAGVSSRRRISLDA